MSQPANHSRPNKDHHMLTYKVIAKIERHEGCFLLLRPVSLRDQYPKALPIGVDEEVQVGRIQFDDTQIGQTGEIVRVEPAFIKAGSEEKTA